MTELPPCAVPDWEIFCQVVDNYGDIGVCWRLARVLVAEHRVSVRLWVDDVAAFARLCPAVRACTAPLRVDGVEVRPWGQPFRAVEPAAVVIEAFGCTLPAVHVEAMENLAKAKGMPAPLWINLEYLSAEDWVAGCHGLASPDPHGRLRKHFFFPGFVPATGGLLREHGLFAEREHFRRSGGREAWLGAHGLDALAPETLVISLFAYEQPALGALIDTWATGTRPILVLVPEGRVLGDVAHAFGCPALAPGARMRTGMLELAVLPFTDQRGYDRLLWSCDLNFVRGEDSFVRAQWAARPLVWHIYAQADEAHIDKLDAFLARYCSTLDAASTHALAQFWRAWNGYGELAVAWPALLAALPALDAHARDWSAALGRQTDLASNLIQFSQHILATRE